MTKLENIQTALMQFEGAAIKHSESTERGDYKTANKSYAVIEKSVLFLKEQNEVQQLLVFLDHDSVGVRMWAASYLLPIVESEGVRVLEQIANGTGIHSLTAKTTLSEWRKGDLKL